MAFSEICRKAHRHTTIVELCSSPASTHHTSSLLFKVSLTPALSQHPKCYKVVMGTISLYSIIFVRIESLSRKLTN